MSQLQLPKFLDILIILDDEITFTKIYKHSTRCTDYINRGLKYLEAKQIIQITENPRGQRMMITLTPKGKDTQKIVITLYNNLGIKITRGTK